MQIPWLVPRLNYHFGLKDLFYSFRGAFSKRSDTQFLNFWFKSGQFYFTNHARTGLRLLLNSLQLPQNAKIGVQVYNCHTVFEAIHLSGYSPIFIDVDFNFRIDIKDLERKKEQLDALIITHTFGIPADIDKIKELIHNIPIIEDCAHAFLSKYKNEFLGNFGDAAVFSIGKGKFPSIGSGGYVVINNKSIIQTFHKLFNELPTPGLISEFKNIFISLVLSFLHNPIVYDLLTSNLIRNLKKKRDLGRKVIQKETKILKTNLFLFSKHKDSFEDYLFKQKNNFSKLCLSYYANEMPEIFNDQSLLLNGFMFPVLTEDPDGTILEFKKERIELGRHFSKSISWALQYGYVKGTCLNAEKIVEMVVTFPCHYNYVMNPLIKRLIKTEVYESIN